MLTKDFMKEVQKLGFETLENTESISILYGCGKVAYVYKNEIFSVDTGYISFDNLSKELKEKLYNLIDKYARTPLDEREEPQKFYLKHKWLTNNNSSFNCLNFYVDENKYFIESDSNMCGFKTQFTQAEIDKIKEKFNTNLDDFEQIPIEEDEE